MRIGLLLLIVFAWSGLAHAYADSDRSDTDLATPFITGYTLTRSRAPEMGSLGRLWDGHKMNVVRGDIGESVAERAFFGGPELAQSKKGLWVSVAPRFRRQGIDHVFLRVDKNGLPNNMILGESKYGSNKLGSTIKNGQQMGLRWRQNHLAEISNRYLGFAKSSGQIIRVKDVPIDAKCIDVYFSKTHKVAIWQSGSKWYTDAEGVSDQQLRTRAATYGRYFSEAGIGRVRTRNFVFRIREQSAGDYTVAVSTLSDEAQITATRSVVVPKEFVARGRVDMKTLRDALKRKHPTWSDRRIVREARDIKRVVSNKEFLNAAKARDQAIKEIDRSSMASAGIAGVFTFAFRIGTEALEHGADFRSYDYEQISLSTVKGAATAGVASFAGQRTALYLAGGTILKRQVSSKMAGRIGGGVGAAIVLAESFGGCVMGDKSWKDGSIETGIGVASMAAGHFAAVGVSAWLAGSATAGAATAGSAVAAGTAAAAAGAGAGAAGSSGLMALAAASGPAIAAIAAGAAISYGGYVVYDHYKSIELVNGEFTFNEKKVDMFLTDKCRFDRSVDKALGLN